MDVDRPIPSRVVSSNRRRSHASPPMMMMTRRMTSMLEQERAEALDLVVDAILAERPPIDAGVDRKHRLVEPEKIVDFI